MFQTPATIESVRTLADGTIKLSVETQELTPENTALLFGMARKLGWFVFKETEVKEEDIPTDKIEFKDDMTLDEHLGKVLYAYHMKKTNDGKTFHTFKRQVYEAIIEKYKNKLSEMD